MSLFVKVVVRASYWNAADAIISISAGGGDMVEPAYFVSGPRSLVYQYGAWGLTGEDGGPVNEEYIFLVPDGFLTIPGPALVTWQFGYDDSEIDILTSSDGGTYTLAGTGSRGYAETLEIDLTESAGPAPFEPWWTDHTNTQEFP